MAFSSKSFHLSTVGALHRYKIGLKLLSLFQVAEQSKHALLLPDLTYTLNVTIEKQ